ncbi:MAG: N-acetyltransferase family protein [Firmicutes bacterium]|nr:N-acetyltransferase family protein [Bacillota bacterium]
MLRLATPDDVRPMLAIYAPYVRETAWTFEYTAPDAAAFARRFSEYTRVCPWLVWEEDGEILGYAHGSLPFEREAYRWCAEVSVYLSPRAQRRGIGRRLYAALERLLQMQGFRRVYAVITAQNTGSVAFHERLGYRQCAYFFGCGIKFQRLWDVIWMEKSFESPELSVEFPTLWESIMENDKNLSDILGILSLS